MCPSPALPKSVELGELALGDAIVPVLIAELEAVVADAIHADFAIILVDPNVQLIPLAGRPGRVESVWSGIGRNVGAIKLVQPARLLRIMSIHIVLDLDFGSGVPWRAAAFEHMEHDAAVATLADLVLQRQLELSVLLHR